MLWHRTRKQLFVLSQIAINRNRNDHPNNDYFLWPCSWNSSQNFLKSISPLFKSIYKHFDLSPVIINTREKFEITSAINKTSKLTMRQSKFQTRNKYACALNSELTPDAKRREIQIRSLTRTKRRSPDSIRPLTTMTDMSNNTLNSPSICILRYNACEIECNQTCYLWSRLSVKRCRQCVGGYS